MTEKKPAQWLCRAREWVQVDGNEDQKADDDMESSVGDSQKRVG